MAFARATACAQKLPLFKVLGSQFNMPRPMMNIINGGAHADNNLDIQEFMIIPNSFADIRESVRLGSEIFHSLKKILHKARLSTSVGDEGGFAPNFGSTDEAIEYILRAIEEAGYAPGHDVHLGFDVAASEFYQGDKYGFQGESLDCEELVDFYSNLVNKYPIISIEDPLSEFDHDGWKLMTEALGERIQIVGDDLFVTNPKLLQDGIDTGLANSILIKLNQIGTVSETLRTINLAHENDYTVASGAWQIKTGSLCRSDRVAKYNELIRIQELNK
jgi:enolase